MVVLNRSEKGTAVATARSEQPGKLARLRLAGELFNGRHRPGESVKLSEIAAQYQLDEDFVLKVFREFQTLGIVTLFGQCVGGFSFAKSQRDARGL